MSFTIKKFIMQGFEQNTYVLYNSAKQAMLIDPGSYTLDDQNRILNFIQKENLQLQYIWLTHAHPDHIFGLHFFASLYNITPHMHAQEIPIFEYSFTMAQQMGFNFTSYGGIFYYVDEATSFFSGDDQIYILHVPGHSTGSIAFYNKKQCFIISGDVLFHRSMGRTDLPYSDYNSIKKSIKEKLYILPEATIVYAGHGEATTIGEERTYNPFIKA